MATDLGELQSKLWETADQLRANSELKSSEYASPVLGLIFLRYADERFAQATAKVGQGSNRRKIGPDDYKAIGALYLAEESRFERLLNQPEGTDLGKAVNKAWRRSRTTTKTSVACYRRTTPASPTTSLANYCDSFSLCPR
ncbi:MAG: type I restriction-modification system subunit M N-terminal domain-containing protein [Acidimicrobiaceae bacterium]|nr:type I restriction-modification system subunit M N-terminal domain-containing protein [Acidimicrobiaceae bacterium]